jgi:hypothetical protein
VYGDVLLTHQNVATLLNDLFGTGFSCSDVYGNIHETKGESYYTSDIHHLTQVNVGVWLSKSPNHNIIVMDIEGLSRKEIEQEEVN